MQRSTPHPHHEGENIPVGLLGFVGELVRALQVGAMHGDSMLRVVAVGRHGMAFSMARTVALCAAEVVSPMWLM